MSELVDEKDPDSQALTKEIVELAEEKVCHHDRGSETCVEATDAGSDSETYVSATDVSANFAGADAAIAVCARPWRSSLCAAPPREVSCGRKSSSENLKIDEDVASEVHGRRRLDVVV